MEYRLKTIVCSLALATGSNLFPLNIALAAKPGEWECTPTPDFRSWNCLKDGKAPVEPVVATEPTPTAPLTDTRPADAEVKPLPQEDTLAEPEPIRAETAETVETDRPAIAQPEPPQPPEHEPRSEAVMAAEPEASPGEAEPPTAAVAPDEPVAEQAPEPETLEARPQAPAPEPVAAQTVAPEETAQPEVAPVQATAPVDTQPKALVQVDESLPSCIAVRQPTTTDSEQRKQRRETSATEISADEAEVLQKDQVTLTGDVDIARADQHLRADRVQLDKKTNQAEAEGSVVYSDDQIELQTDQAHVDMDADVNVFEGASFTTAERYARGTADRVTTERGEVTTLEKATYTTCPPGNSDWELTADKIVLDDSTGRGESRNTKVTFKGVPVFYSPYLTFPIDDRRMTGVLTPRFGRSDDRGTELTVPIYWNIAPDRDATFYPRYMSRRGLQLGGEYRYLNERNHGQVNMEYLADDKEYKGKDDDRWAFKYLHSGTIYDKWFLGAQIERVSDKQYFEDLGTSLKLTSRTHLRSDLILRRGDRNWSFNGLLRDYQTVDETIADINAPYEQMPNLNFDVWSDRFAGGFQARVETQYVDFDHDLRVTGKRTDIYPSITYDYNTAGYYIRPKFGLRHTHYSLDNQGVLPESQQRSTPVLSLDSGLFFERDTELFGGNMLQTLEPRFYYLRIPDKNQSQIPVFDTGIYDYSADSLFRENRFSSIDRINDANQLSVGITSRFLDHETGAERFGFTLGQIYYFEDRDVTLPGRKPDTDHTSPLIAEVRYSPDKALTASALWHRDFDASVTERVLYKLKYQPEDDKILNMAYRFREDRIKQTDVSFLWPLDKGKRWHAVGRWNHSLKHAKSLDTFAGLEYESCCWKTRLVARRWVNDINSDYDTGIFFEIELKGLGSFGDDITSFLETGILGYDRFIQDEDDDTYYY